MSTVTRRTFLGRAVLLAAGTVAVLALPEPASAVVAAPEPDAGAYRGPILVHLSTEEEIRLGTTLAALFVRLDDARPDPVRLWVNDRAVSVARRPAVERWARRQLGAGESFGVVFTGDPEWLEIIA